MTLNFSKARTKDTDKPVVLPTVAYSGMRLESFDGVKPRRQCNPQRKSREGGTSPLIPWGWELGSNGKVNICELLINAVTNNKPKVLIGLSQKARV